MKSAGNIVKTIVFLAVIAIVFPIICMKDRTSNTEGKLEKYILTQTNLGKFSGAVLVAHHGTVLYRKGIGFSGSQSNARITPETRFALGDMCAPITAMGILILEQESKINLSDELDKYIGWLPEQTGKITIGQILTQVSALPDYREIAYYKENLQNGLSVDTLIQEITSLPLKFNPGKAHSRSMSNFIILNKVIEEISGVNYTEFIQNSIFDKLGMHNSGCFRNAGDVDACAEGFQTIGDTPEPSPEIHFRTRLATAPFYSTVDDLFKLDRALKDDKLLLESAKEDMFTPHSDVKLATYKYGYGWYVFSLFGKKVCGHDSHYTGQTGRMLRFPNDDLFVAVLSNYAAAPIVLIPRDLAAIVLGADYEFPHKRKEIQISEKRLKKLSGTFALNNDTLSIEYAGDYLHIVYSNGVRRQIIPETNKIFFIEGRDTYYSFRKSFLGKAEAFIIHWGGHELVYRKVEETEKE